MDCADGPEGLGGAGADWAAERSADSGEGAEAGAEADAEADVDPIGPGGGAGEAGPRLSPGSGDGPDADAEPDAEDVPGGRIQRNKGRALQVTMTGGRRYFDAERQRVFLEWFAATANLGFSAVQAGVNYKTVCRHRMNDPVFAAGWNEALEQSLARLKARLLETPAKEARIGIEGDWDAPPIAELDVEQALRVLAALERAVADMGSGLGRPTGAPPRVASNAEVRESLVRALKAFGERVEEPDEGDPDADPEDWA